MLVYEPLGLVYFTYITMHKHCQYCNLQPTMWRTADKFPLNSIVKSIDIGGVVNMNVGKILVYILRRTQLGPVTKIFF